MIKNLFKSIAIAILMVLFPIMASVIIQVNNIKSDILGYGIQTIFFAIASTIGIIIYKKVKYNKKDKGSKIYKQVLWYTPIIISEIIVFSSKIDLSKDIFYYIILLIFTVFVGISEELFFRGIILNILSEKSKRYAILVSAILFSILHLTNIAGGISIKYVVLQVVFSFIFGVVAGQITVISRSLLPAIIWHFTHDFIAFLTGNELSKKTIIVLVVQCVILLIYSVYLSKKINKNI
ncbi:CPBP family intramembrane glutamic endopeptidase [Miniphocaeibacter massiliensis]|uniref:CPBP family intramembrane glutamic endopeptidase n=1 Tax=Miniphocaeibacter massiliensis TaxID=2041841 RepID=UPI000C06C5C1|nr:CPBP family intramembrane glutamic endopeptidase [Miniphocaeibacter massiliensis]